VLRVLIALILAALVAPATGQTTDIPNLEADPVQVRLERVTGETARVSKLARNIDARLTSMREEFGTSGLNDGNRLMLEETRQTLPAAVSSQQRIAWIQQEIRWLKLQILENEQDLDAGLHSAVANASDHTHQPGEPKPLHEMHEYLIALGKLASVHVLLVDNIRLMQTFLDRQLLWVADASPVSLSDFGKLTACTARLGNPQPWIELSRRFGARLNSDPWQLGIVLVLVIASGVMAHRLGADGDPRKH